MASSDLSVSAPLKPRSQAETVLEKVFRGLTLVFALGIGFILVMIALVIFWESIPAMQKSGLGFLVSSEWDPVRNLYGALPVIYG
ncbi:MAG: phosphate ABC transporter permease subunit PstC, partial [Microcystaceae cyanobacterium]